MSDDIEDDDPSHIQMSVSIPLDGHSCIRRECPHCGLEFKVDASEDVSRDLLAWSVSRILRSHGVDQDDGVEEPAQESHCPYCQHSAKTQDFLHPEQWAYMHKLVFREYVEPMFSQMMESAFGGFQGNSFLKITHESGPRSPRPMIGPDSTDMARVRCLACSTLFKVSDRWRGSIRCTSCATDLLAM